MDEPQRMFEGGDPPEELVVLPRGSPDGMDHPPEEMRGGFGESIDSVVRGIGRRVAAALPWLESPLSVCRGLYADAYVRTTRAKYNLTHAASIDPFRILYVDPDRITMVAEPTGISRFRRAGAVVDGDWDRSGIRFADTDVYQAFQARFLDGTPWEDTEFFRRVIDEINGGSEPWGCGSRSAFQRRCRQLDQLYESIRDAGFRTQRELARSRIEDPFDKPRGTVSARVLTDEIAVDIGRDGELLYSDGRNRLAIAKVLGVDAIPVVVLRRHTQWVTLRDAVVTYVERTGDLSAPFCDHPDIEPYLE